MGKRINHRNSYATYNGLKTSLSIFFLENAKNLGRSDDAKPSEKKKGMALLLQLFCKRGRSNVLLKGV